MEAFRTRLTVVIDDLSTTDRWPDHLTVAQGGGLHAVVGHLHIPITED